jgi:hypothetical protein
VAALRAGSAEFRHDLGSDMAEVRHAWTGRRATTHPHSEKRLSRHAGRVSRGEPNAEARPSRRTGRSKGKS